MLGTDRPMVLLEPQRGATPVGAGEASGGHRQPLVSCIMASRGRVYPALLAVECFSRQSYARCELVIATAATDGLLRERIEALDDPAVRLIEVPTAANVGTLRNLAIAESSGDLLSVWDDDDLSHPDRLSLQVRALAAAEADACFLARVMLWWPARQMLAASGPRIWENTMLVERQAFPGYPGNRLRDEDTIVAKALRESHRIVLHDVPEAYCYIAHGGNLWDAGHFEMLFGGASRNFAGAAYAQVLVGLSGVLPMSAYEEGLVTA